MKIMKKTSLALLALALIFTAACGTQSPAATPTPEPTIEPTIEPTAAPEPVNVRVGALKGPTGIGMVGIMENGSSAANTYEFTLAGAPDELTGKLITGELDIVAVPVNAGANLYSKTEGEVILIAASTVGNLYVLENGEEIDSVEDLRGKTIYSAGKGATPEFAMKYILEAHGIDPENDVDLVYLSEHAEVTTQLATNPGAVGVVPEPFATSGMKAAEGIHVALDLSNAWDSAAALEGRDGSRLVMSCIVARKAFLDEQPAAVDAFLADYNASVEFVTTQVSDAAALVEAHGIMPSAAVAEQAIPRCGIAYIAGADMKPALGGIYEILFENNPNLIGGSIPDEAFYYLG